MNQYKVVFTVNGRRTEQVVSANDSMSAKKLIEAQYSNCKITFYDCRRI